MAQVNDYPERLKWRSDEKRGYFQDRFFPPDEGREYLKHKMLLGQDIEGNEVFLPTNKSYITTVVGARGSGKSYTLEGMVSRTASAGHGVSIPVDIKPEYYLMRKPLQSKFHKFLGPNEVPISIPTYSFYPLIFKKFVKKLKGYDQLVQLSFDQLNLYDFMTVLNLKLTDPQRIAIETSFTRAKDKGYSTFEEMMKILVSNPDISDTTIRSIKAAINNAMAMGAIGDAYSDFSFPAKLNEGMVPILNLYGWARMGQQNSLPAAFVSVVVRDLLAAKAEGDISAKKLWLFLDEAPRFCPREGGENLSSKREILQMVDLGRSYGISMVFGTQSIKKIPEVVVEQSRFILLSPLVDFSTAKDTVFESGIFKDTHPMVLDKKVQKIRINLKVHRDGSRVWALLDRQNKTLTYLRNYAPLCYHLCET